MALAESHFGTKEPISTESYQGLWSKEEISSMETGPEGCRYTEGSSKMRTSSTSTPAKDCYPWRTKDSIRTAPSSLLQLVPLSGLMTTMLCLGK